MMWNKAQSDIVNRREELEGMKDRKGYRETWGE